MDDAGEKRPQLTIYTDGACSPNPGPGGWGAVVLERDSVLAELSGYGGESTNNRMELTAAVEALRSLERPHRLTLYTDSQYVRNGITDWITKWQRNNWQTADRKPVKNADLWQALLEQIRQHQVEWKWVRGHGTNRWNNRADELAVQARLDGGGAAPVRRGTGSAGLSPDHIHFFTGVTCKHSTGEGGWCVILCWRNHVRVIGGGEVGMTANQLYLRAVTAGLESLKKPLPVIVHTHSGYLYDGATTWLEGWRRRDWKTREGNPVSNREWWQKITGFLDRYTVEFQREEKDNPLCAMLEAKELAREFEQGH